MLAEMTDHDELAAKKQRVPETSLDANVLDRGEDAWELNNSDGDDNVAAFESVACLRL